MYTENTMKFMICPGNNSKLLREVMRRRSWWVEIPPMPCMANFKWAPVSNGIKFAHYDSANGVVQVVNHLEGHWNLSEKSKMFHNMQYYYEKNKENVFAATPITFFI